jgi:hypothetical protein
LKLVREYFEVLSAFTVNSESNDFAETAGIALPDTLDVTIVDCAAVTEPAATPTNNPATIINTLARKIAFDLVGGLYMTK